MKGNIRIGLLVVCTLIPVSVVLLLKAFAQELSYHQFADQSARWGIRNFSNVVSNLPFVAVGVYGLWMLRRSTAQKTINIIYEVMFSAVILTGLGSAFYHAAPDNNRLVLDRIPMTLVFMSFLSATICSWIGFRTGSLLFIPLLLLGIFSVLWWRYTELGGKGDLRLYAFVQFYPLVIIPLILLLFASPVNNRGLPMLIGVIAWYVLAKIVESFDGAIYTATGFISGHSLKHLAAAMATLYIVLFFKRKYTGVAVP